MIIKIDTDKKKIVVPWNYFEVLSQMRKDAVDLYGMDEETAKTKFGGSQYLKDIFERLMVNTDETLTVADKPVGKKKKDSTNN